MLKKISLDNLSFYIIGLLFSILFSGYRFTNMMDDWIGFDRLIKHDFHRPFVTRPLIPWIAEVLVKLGFLPEKSFQVLEILGCFLMLVLFEKYIRNFLINKSFSKIAAFLILLFVPYYLIMPRLINLWYPYDIWATTINIALLLCLYRKKYFVYYLLFVVGTVNRETTCFVTIAMLFICLGEMPFRRLFIHLLCQLCLWLVTRSILEHIFAHTGGGLYEDNFRSNLGYLWNLLRAGGINDGSYGKSLFHAISLIAALSYLFSNFYIVRYWKMLDNRFLKRAFLTFIPYYFIVLLIGNIFEYRLMAEMLPLALAPLIVIVEKKLIQKS
jgi:hypothetical protein